MNRSAIMACVRSKNTAPERRVRSLLHRLGYRFRLHAAELPGRPDIVLRPRRAAILVHGCFWHGHDCPRGARKPKTNQEYWEQKIARNSARDAETLAALAGRGYRALEVWDCELRDEAALARRLEVFLGTRPPPTGKSGGTGRRTRASGGEGLLFPQAEPTRSSS